MLHKIISGCQLYYGFNDCTTLLQVVVDADSINSFKTRFDNFNEYLLWWTGGIFNLAVSGIMIFAALILIVLF